MAHDVTALVHGAEACNAVVAASEALFCNGDLATIDPHTFESALDSLPRATVTPSTSVAEALVETGLCSSVSDARRAIAQGGVSINNNTVTEETAELGERQAPSDVALLLKRGKKTLAALFFV